MQLKSICSNTFSRARILAVNEKLELHRKEHLPQVNEGAKPGAGVSLPGRPHGMMCGSAVTPSCSSSSGAAEPGAPAESPGLAWTIPGPGPLGGEPGTCVLHRLRGGGGRAARLPDVG